MKQCPRCKEFSDNFNKNKSKPDGLQNYCRVCQAESSRKYNHSDKGKTRIVRYKSAEEFKSKNKVWQKKYSQTGNGILSNRKKVIKYQVDNPAVKKAHDAIYYARKIGKIPSPEALQCLECGNQAKEYHHHLGYAKENRLNVIPLCIPCHKAISQNSYRQSELHSLNPPE